MTVVVPTEIPSINSPKPHVPEVVTFTHAILAAKSNPKLTSPATSCSTGTATPFVSLKAVAHTLFASVGSPRSLDSRLFFQPVAGPGLGVHPRKPPFVMMSSPEMTRSTRCFGSAGATASALRVNHAEVGTAQPSTTSVTTSKSAVLSCIFLVVLVLVFVLVLELFCFSFFLFFFLVGDVHKAGCSSSNNSEFFVFCSLACSLLPFT